jgi:hypothetical protein
VEVLLPRQGLRRPGMWVLKIATGKTRAGKTASLLADAMRYARPGGNGRMQAEDVKAAKVQPVI